MIDHKIHCRQSLLEDPDLLIVYRDPLPPQKPAPGQPGTHSDFLPTEPELFIAVLASGQVLAFNGHVDLGTGIRTALAQIVAEELNVELDDVSMVLGNPFEVPNQGPTLASATIQVTAEPLRRAAAQAREYLLGMASRYFDVARDKLACHKGSIAPAHSTLAPMGYGDLLRGARHALRLDANAPLKPISSYQLVGQSSARVDIPDKVIASLTFVHDVRMPNMLHGRVVRPPYTGHDCGSFVGTSLISVDESSVSEMPGVVKVVVDGDFVGVVAEREEQAAAAARQLKVVWRSPASLPDMNNIEQTLTELPAQRRLLLEEGEIDQALDTSEYCMRRRYLWPFQLHGSIGPSCSVADYQHGKLTVWSGTQNPHSLRADLSRLMLLDEGAITVTRMEVSGCYGRNCADDVGGDAALLSRAVGHPVRVQLTREQEHLWEPKGAAQLMEVEAGIDAEGALTGYRFATRYPSNNAPLLALLLTGIQAPSDTPFQMGDRTSVPPYRYRHRHISCDDVPTLVRASWLRGVSAMPNAFAHECAIDELAHAAGADPVAFRCQHLGDARAVALVEALAEKAGWQTRRAFNQLREKEGWLYGRGFAYSQYVHSKFPGFGAALAAWAVELKVHPASGQIKIERLYVAQDAGLMVNPAGVRHQVHGNIIQTLSRTLKESVAFEGGMPVSSEWGSYPILRFSELPPIELLLLDRPEEAPLGVGESTSLPGAPAIANAIFDATGVRLTHPPFTAERLRPLLKGILPDASPAGLAV